MPASETSGERLNLKQATVLILDPNAQSMPILRQVLSGFGAKHFHICLTLEEARSAAGDHTVDLIFAEGQTADGEPVGYDFIHWLRRSELDPNAYAPAILAGAHTSLRNVARGRDCGAHFFVTMPVSPSVLFERVHWIARTNRRFVDAGCYVGPDRRFKNDGPPPGTDGRRSTDLTREVGAAVDPNMSQSDIDALLTPKRGAL